MSADEPRLIDIKIGLRSLVFGSKSFQTLDQCHNAALCAVPVPNPGCILANRDTRLRPIVLL